MIDILLNEQHDIAIANGDLVLGDARVQQQQVLLLSKKGDFKQYPTTGIGIQQYINDDEPAKMVSDVVSQFTADGILVNKVAFENGQLIIDASNG